MRLVSSVLAATLVFSAPSAMTVHAGDVHTMLARSQLRVQAADFRATGHLVRVDAGGVRTSYAIRLKAHWFPDGLRVLLEITSPIEAQTHVLLQMRPSGQATIQVAYPGDRAPATLPFDRWSDGPLGSEFSYEDFLEPQYFWQNQSLLEETKYDARECDVLKSTPDRSDRTQYAEIHTWLDQSIGYPVYAEKVLKGTNTIKEFTYLGLRQSGGVWSSRQVEVKIRGRAGSTLLIIDHGSTKAGLGLNEFSPEKLIRF